MTARVLMFQGMGSDVGKSLIVAGLCRLLANRGLTIRPFKPQNMSNNAAVTVDGGEIGRAQALQARAARQAPTVHMNPVLLKPQSEIGAQVIVQGEVATTLSARDFQTFKSTLMPRVLQSFERVKKSADFVLVEGAGSASETNLRTNDIANMGFATAGNVPVVLIGDIDRGGVIASLVGTHTVLPATDRGLVAGFIVNRMRGDHSLFAEGMRDIAERTGWLGLGIVPHFAEAHKLPAEDALALQERERWAGSGAEKLKLKIAVPILPHIANFDDLDPLRLDPNVEFITVSKSDPIPGDVDLIILSGSKATIADLGVLRQSGLDIDILAHVRRGGCVLGLCGGYQMLGKEIHDKHGIEGSPASIAGLGLLDVRTELSKTKTLRDVTGETLSDGVSFRGYEIHMGLTSGPDTEQALVRFSDGRVDGAIAKNGRVFGTYAHGFFADDEQRQAWIKRLGRGHFMQGEFRYDEIIEETLNALADHLERHLDVDAMMKLAR